MCAVHLTMNHTKSGDALSVNIQQYRAFNSLGLDHFSQPETALFWGAFYFIKTDRVMSRK